MPPMYPGHDLPPPPKPKGTPLPHCVAAAGVWWAAMVVASAAGVLKAGSEWRGVLGTAVFGAVVWLVTAWLMRLLTRTSPFQPWVLIFLTLPLFLAVLVVVAITVFAIIAIFVLPA